MKRAAAFLAMLASACASFAPAQSPPDFSWLAGCWIGLDGAKRVHWSPFGAAGGWRGDIDWTFSDCAAAPTPGACAYFIVRDAHGTWCFIAAETHNIATYRLASQSRNEAVFLSEGHPQRPAGRELYVEVVDGALIIAETDASGAKATFQGARGGCE